MRQSRAGGEADEGFVELSFSSSAWFFSPSLNVALTVSPGSENKAEGGEEGGGLLQP